MTTEGERVGGPGLGKGVQLTRDSLLDSGLVKEAVQESNREGQPFRRRGALDPTPCRNSKMIAGGMDSFLVARLAGTSTAMINQHYGHLRHDKTREELDAVKLM